MSGGGASGGGANGGGDWGATAACAPASSTSAVESSGPELQGSDRIPRLTPRWTCDTLRDARRWSDGLTFSSLETDTDGCMLSSFSSFERSSLISARAKSSCTCREGLDLRDDKPPKTRVRL